MNGLSGRENRLISIKDAFVGFSRHAEGSRGRSRLSHHVTDGFLPHSWPHIDSRSSDDAVYDTMKDIPYVGLCVFPCRKYKAWICVSVKGKDSTSCGYDTSVDLTLYWPGLASITHSFNSHRNIMTFNRPIYDILRNSIGDEKNTGRVQNIWVAESIMLNKISNNNNWYWFKSFPSFFKPICWL